MAFIRAKKALSLEPFINLRKYLVEESLFFTLDRLLRLVIVWPRRNYCLGNFFDTWSKYRFKPSHLLFYVIKTIFRINIWHFTFEVFDENFGRSCDEVIVFNHKRERSKRVDRKKTLALVLALQGVYDYEGMRDLSKFE